jgi:type I restriction enzyme S subunit
MDELPKGWCESKLEDCVEILDKIRVPVNSDERCNRKGGIPYYGATGQVGWIDDFLFDEQLVLLGEDGAPFLDKSKPIAYIIEGKSWVNNHAHVLKAIRGLITNHFIKHVLDAIDFHDFVNGTTRLKLTQAAMRDIPVLLPPYAEQERIVAKVEALLARVNAVRQRLAKVPPILKRFRQAVLAAACSGRLTAEWREKQGELEPADLLVDRVRRRFRDRERQPDLVDHESLEELPPPWMWAAFGEVIEELRNGISTKPNSDPPGHPILRISATRPGKVLLDDIRYLPNGDELVNSYRLRDGDLLFTRYNGSLDLLGVCGMVRGLRKRTLLYPDKLMRVRFGHEDLLPEYVEAFFGSPLARDRVEAKSKSSAGQQGVSGADIKRLPIAVPPLPEQHEIVRRVEALFRLAEVIEKRLVAATTRAEKLTQAILAKAFRGELVPTEAELARREGRDYEPASALLERIRAERAANNGKPIAKRKTRK